MQTLRMESEEGEQPATNGLEESGVIGGPRPDNFTVLDFPIPLQTAFLDVHPLRFVCIAVAREQKGQEMKGIRRDASESRVTSATRRRTRHRIESGVDNEPRPIGFTVPVGLSLDFSPP